MAIRVLVADNHEVVRTGLRSILVAAGIDVVGEARNGDETVALSLQLNPDIVLLDVRMPGNDGLNALGRIKLERPNMQLLVLSTYDNPTIIARSLALGASGYLIKTASSDEVVDAVRRTAAGESLWSPDEVRKLGTHATMRLTDDVEVPLTKRESEVLGQLALGLTNKEIAKVLGISYETVKEHVQHILRKVGVSDRTQAAVWAVRKGLV